MNTGYMVVTKGDDGTSQPSYPVTDVTKVLGLDEYLDNKIPKEKTFDVTYYNGRGSLGKNLLSGNAEIVLNYSSTIGSLKVIYSFYYNNKLYLVANPYKASNILSAHFGIYTWDMVSDDLEELAFIERQVGTVSCCLIENKVYCFGGTYSLTAGNTINNTTDTYIYDIETDDWEINTQFTNIVSFVSGSKSADCYYLDGLIYMYLGSSAALRIFKIADDSLVTYINAPTIAALASTKAVMDEVNEKLYIAGVGNKTTYTPSIIMTYDIKTKQFSTLFTYTEVESFAQCKLLLDNDILYIFTGLQGTSYKRHLYTYNLTTNKLQRHKDLSLGMWSVYNTPILIDSKIYDMGVGDSAITFPANIRAFSITDYTYTKIAEIPAGWYICNNDTVLLSSTSLTVLDTQSTFLQVDKDTEVYVEIGTDVNIAISKYN